MFTLKVIVSFLAGGLFIAFQSLIAERVSVRVRGLVLTIPTTMALGFFFVGLTKTPMDVRQVATVFPAALAPTYIFVVAFAALSYIGLLVSFVGSFFLWGIASYVLLRFPPHDFTTSTFLYGLPVIFISYFLIKKLSHSNAKITPVPMNLKHIIIRSIIGGSVIVAVVIFSKLLGNIWGALLSGFPAAFSATFLIYYWVHGKEVIPLVAKNLYFPGAIGFILYAWTATYAFPKYSIWIGTLVSYAVCLSFTFVYTYLLKKLPNVFR